MSFIFTEESQETSDALNRPGDAYLLDADNIMHGPYASLLEAATVTLGDYPGIVEFALGPLHVVAVIHSQKSPDVWEVIGDLHSLESRRCDHLANFLSCMSAGDARIVLSPRRVSASLTTSIDKLSDAFNKLQGRHVPMRVLELGDREIAARRLASDLVQAWVQDDKEWGATVTKIIEQYRIRPSIVSVNMATMSFEWPGPALTYLDDNPGRLINAPITALQDQSFVQGIIVDLHRATAASRPYLCEIETPLNGVDVNYEILSLPLHDRRTGKIVSCMRVPLVLTVKAPPPEGFDAARSPLKTTFKYG